MTETPKRHVVRRPAVVRKLLSLYEAPSYLEIGVCAGATFHKVEAPRKVAVDPEFRFDHEQAQRDHPGTEYHQVTSDEYFGRIIAEDETFDVIFLDGLHTFEQTLRDLNNALLHLQPHGVMLIDDVSPPTYLASVPDRETFFRVREWMGVTDKAWMGDVFKLVHFIETFHQGLSFRTISNNHGQAVVWRERRPSVRERTVADIGTLSFEQFVLEQGALRSARFGVILRELRARAGPAPPLRRPPDSPPP